MICFTATTHLFSLDTNSDFDWFELSEQIDEELDIRCESALRLGILDVDAQISSPTNTLFGSERILISLIDISIL